MSKDITAKDVAAWLAAQGEEIPDKVKAAVENAKSDEAFHKISPMLRVTDTVKNEKAATAWQKAMFKTAKDMRAEFKSETRNQQGRGNAQVEVISVTVETEDGTLTTKLTRPVESKKTEKSE